MKSTTKLTPTIENIIILLYLALYALLSLSFLTDFPFIHSDEAWLSGLTRSMMEEESFAATESFFDARPRYPHAIKLLFHGLQMLATFFSGYSITTFRLLSLLFSLLTLYVFFCLCRKLFKQFIPAGLLTVILSLDIQFIYSSHMARQESMILFFLVLCLYRMFAIEKPYTNRNMILTAVITGISIGFHPNSFLIACMVGCLSLTHLVFEKSRDFKPLLTYIGVTGLFAAVFVGISYSFDPLFLTHYFSNGAEEFGIDAAFGDRFSGLLGFLSRLFLGEGGTYYVADIRLQFILFAAAALLLLFFCLVMIKDNPSLCRPPIFLLSAAFGILGGIFVIGRYSQLSVVFLFPAGWLLVSYAVTLFSSPEPDDENVTEEDFTKNTPKIKPIPVPLLHLSLLLLVAFLGFSEIRPYLSGETYENFLTKVSTYVEPDATVIGNLNMDYFFENGKLHDYRNLPYIMESEGSLDSYIKRNQIEYIFYTDELTYYFEHRPYYNSLYGNIMFAGDLLRYCNESCELVGEFESPRYAPRILELLEKDEYATIYIYKTKLME